MVYPGLLQQGVDFAAEPVQQSRVEPGVVVFEDDPDVDVVLVVGSGPVLRDHVIDDELMGQVFGEFRSYDAGDFLQ